MILQIRGKNARALKQDRVLQVTSRLALSAMQTGSRYPFGDLAPRGFCRGFVFHGWGDIEEYEIELDNPHKEVRRPLLIEVDTCGGRLMR